MIPPPRPVWQYPQVVYVGTGQPNQAINSPVPVFLSASRLQRYKSRGENWPIVQSGAGWAGDSGAFTALVQVGPNPIDKKTHPWWMHPEDYGAMWVRLADDIIWPDFVACQDWPCEIAAREATGKSTRWHIEATIENYLYLAAEFRMVPWLPVLQGWLPEDYRHAAKLYEQAGVDLSDGRLVGLGSICRRGSEREIAELVEHFTLDRGMRLHGFGVSKKALSRIGWLLGSSDTQAWSYVSRAEHTRLPGCTHVGRDGQPNDCRNCFRWAIAYREEMLAAIEDSRRNAAHPRYAQPSLWDGSDISAECDDALARAAEGIRRRAPALSSVAFAPHRALTPAHPDASRDGPALPRAATPPTTQPPHQRRQP